MRMLSIGLLFLAVACGGKADKASPTVPAPVGEDQVTMGGRLYGQSCAGCHGASGEGTDKGPAVVGAGALPLDPRPGQKRAVQFRTALDVFEWTKVAMPGDDPGSLTDEEYLAIMAFALTANGVDLQGKPLDGPTAAAIVLHPE